MSQELKPCPFCGAGPLNLQSGLRYVFCSNCGAMGPDIPLGEYNRARAALLWNGRSELPLKNVAETQQDSDRK